VMAGYRLVRYSANQTTGEYQPSETVIGDADALEQALRALLLERPQFIELVAPNEDVMVIGLGGSAATVGFGTLEMQQQGEQVGAIGTPPADSAPSRDFDAGGTPSPIDRSLLILPSEMLTIAQFFFRTGGLHPDFAWE
jgi:hypothetical protein